MFLKLPPYSVASSVYMYHIIKETNIFEIYLSASKRANLPRMNLSQYLDPATRPGDLKLYNPSQLTPYKVGQIKTDSKYASKFQDHEKEHAIRRQQFQMKQKRDLKKFKKEQMRVLNLEKSKKVRPQRLIVLEGEISTLQQGLKNPKSFENISDFLECKEKLEKTQKLLETLEERLYMSDPKFGDPNTGLFATQHDEEVVFKQKQECDLYKFLSDYEKSTKALKYERTKEIHRVRRLVPKKSDYIFSIWFGASRNLISRMSALLDKDPTLLNKPDTDSGLVPLHFACKSGHLECVKFLIQRGAEVNAIDPDSLNRPLHFAAGWGTMEICGELLLNGADPYAKNREGQTAQDLAREYEHKSTLKLLTNWLPVGYSVDYLVKSFDLDFLYGVDETAATNVLTPGFETKKAKYRKQLKLQENVLQLKVEKYKEINPSHPSIIITLKKVAVLQRECGEIEKSKRNLQIIANTITKSFKSSTTSEEKNTNDGSSDPNSISRIRHERDNDKTSINLLIDQAWAYNELGNTYLRSEIEEEKEHLSVEYFEKALVCVETANEKHKDMRRKERDQNWVNENVELMEENVNKDIEDKKQLQDVKFGNKFDDTSQKKEEREFYVNMNLYLEIAHCNLALCYLSNNQVHEAEPILQKLLEIQNGTRTLKEFTSIKNIKGYDIVVTMDLLAYTNVLLRRFTEAHKLYQEALEIGKVYYPIGSIQIGERYEQIALCYFMEGKNKEAEKYFRLAHDSYVKSKVFSIPQITSGGIAGEHFFGRESKYNTGIISEIKKQDKKKGSRKSPKRQNIKKKSPTNKTSPTSSSLRETQNLSKSNEDVQSKKAINAIARCINNIAVCICRHNNADIKLSKNAKRPSRTIYF